MTVGNPRYAVVTGASTGLGRCIALELAKRKINTILTALPGENLAAVSETCREMGTESEYFEFDMSDKSALSDFAGTINGRYEVFALVNNAGLGGSRRFGEAPLRYIDTMVQVNVAATVILTHEFLQNLRRNARSYILNISSMAGVVPSGYKTVYPASKAFIRYFSLGMREEFKPDDISVSLAVLGPMPTKQEIASRIDRQGFLGKALSLKPERVAEACVDGMFKGKRTIVPGVFNRFSMNLLKLAPECLSGMLMSRQVRRHEL